MGIRGDMGWYLFLTLARTGFEVTVSVGLQSFTSVPLIFFKSSWLSPSEQSHTMNPASQAEERQTVQGIQPGCGLLDLGGSAHV